jgi:uncharacterized BrkB/YihY/UPF0761 family membrane protein
MAVSAKTGKPIVAGIINITAGCIKLLGATYLALLIANVLKLTWLDDLLNGSLFVVWISMMLLIIFSLIAITGGVSNIKRVRWTWALTGSIITIFPCVILGIITTILTTLSKNEFN